MLLLIILNSYLSLLGFVFLYDWLRFGRCTSVKKVAIHVMSGFVSISVGQCLPCQQVFIKALKIISMDIVGHVILACSLLHLIITRFWNACELIYLIHLNSVVLLFEKAKLGSLIIRSVYIFVWNFGFGVVANRCHFWWLVWFVSFEFWLLF